MCFLVHIATQGTRTRPHSAHIGVVAVAPRPAPFVAIAAASQWCVRESVKAGCGAGRCRKWAPARATSKRLAGLSATRHNTSALAVLRPRWAASVSRQLGEAVRRARRLSRVAGQARAQRHRPRVPGGTRDRAAAGRDCALEGQRESAIRGAPTPQPLAVLPPCPSGKRARRPASAAREDLHSRASPARVRTAWPRAGARARLDGVERGPFPGQ